MDGTIVEVSFQNGAVKRYDVAAMFRTHPQMEALRDRKLFCAGRLFSYGIIWNDELDLETETIYQEGVTVREERRSACADAGEAVLAARARRGLSQKQLAQRSGIDQGDISRIERGKLNPSLELLQRLAEALETDLVIELKDREIPKEP